jgi:hypothetical protein
MAIRCADFIKIENCSNYSKKMKEKNMSQYERTNWKYESRKGTNFIDESSKLTNKKCSIAMIIIDESLSYLTSISVVSTFSKKKKDIELIQNHKLIEMII